MELLGIELALTDYERTMDWIDATVERRQRRYVIPAAVHCVMVVGILVLVLAGASLVPFLALAIPASLAAVGLTVWLVRNEVPLRPGFDWGEWRLLIRDVLPFAAVVLVSLIYFRVALIVLSLVSSARETGFFGASFRVTEVLMSVPQLLVVSAFPIFVRAARDDSERLSYGVGRMFHAMLILGVAFALVLVLGAPFVIDVVAGPAFGPAAPVMRGDQAVTLLVVFLVVPLNYALLSLREHRTMLIITGGALAINAAGAAWLGAADGARGAAVGTLVADMIGLVATGYAVARLGLPVGRWLAVVPRVALGVAIAAIATQSVPV